MKDFDRYQDFTDAMVKDQHFDDDLVYPVLGLASEAGEVADKLKKNIRDHGGIWTTERTVEMAKELGDVLWCVARVARKLGIPLSKVAELNVAKLTNRLARNRVGGNGDNR